MKIRKKYILIAGYVLIFVPVLIAWHLFFNDFFFIQRFEIIPPGGRSFEITFEMLILARVIMMTFVLCSISKFGYFLVNYACKYLD